MIFLTSDNFSHAPFNGFVNPPPLRIMGLLLKASAFGPGLLGNIQGAGVNDVTTLACPKSGIDQLLILLAAPPVSAREWLATTHHHLGRQQSHVSSHTLVWLLWLKDHIVNTGIRTSAQHPCQTIHSRERVTLYSHSEGCTWDAFSFLYE